VLGFARHFAGATAKDSAARVASATLRLVSGYALKLSYKRAVQEGIRCRAGGSNPQPTLEEEQSFVTCKILQRLREREIGSNKYYELSMTNRGTMRRDLASAWPQGNG
jgi:hypothetical protein